MPHPRMNIQMLALWLDPHEILRQPLPTDLLHQVDELQALLIEEHERDLVLSAPEVLEHLLLRRASSRTVQLEIQLGVDYVLRARERYNLPRSWAW